MSRIRRLALPTVITVGLAVGVTTVGGTSASATHGGGGVHQAAEIEIAIPATSVGFSTPDQGPKQLCFYADTTPENPPADADKLCVPTSGAIGETIDGVNALIEATYVLSSSTHPNSVASRVGKVCPDDDRDGTTDTEPHFGAIWEISNATYQPGSSIVVTATVNGTPQEVLNEPAPQPGEGQKTVYLTGIALC